MFRQFKFLLGLAAVAALSTLPAAAAPSAVPGTLDYVEGQVTVDHQAVTPQSVGAVQLQPNQVLSTAQGKAEVLLTPGIFLRIGDNSSVRMVMDTRVEVLGGEAMVEATDVLKDRNVRVMLNGASTRLTKNGVYVFNANSGQVSVLDGKAVVDRDDRHVDLKKGHRITWRVR